MILLCAGWWLLGPYKLWAQPLLQTAIARMLMSGLMD